MAATPEKPRQNALERAQTARKGQDGGRHPSDISRAMPHNAEAELALLCAMSLDGARVIPDAVQRFGLSGDAFHSPIHAATYIALTSLWKAGLPVDEVSLANRLKDQKDFTRVGGENFITEVFNFLPNAFNATAYAEIVAEKHLLRTVISEGSQMVSRAYDDKGDAPELLKDFEQMLFRLLKSRGRKRKTILETVTNVMTSLADPEAAFGISTGYGKLDAIVGGLASKAKIVVAGLTSGGKSAFAHNLAISLAVRRNIPTAIFTFEMSAEETAQRIIQTRSEVNARRVARNEADMVLVNRFNKAAAEVSDSPLYIVDDELDLTGLEAEMMRLKIESGLRVAVIDYLQIIPESKERGENETNLLDRMSKATKRMARRLEITIIELSQLTKKEDGSLVTRQSSGITNDADQLWILEHDEDRPGFVNLIISKQRNGPKDSVEFVFQKDITRFFEPSYVEKKKP